MQVSESATDNYSHLNQVAEEVGTFIQYWGFKKIHGKVWTHIYLALEPLDAADLMERLEISKSLVSITLNDLLHYNVIFRKGKGPKDTAVYTCNPEVRAVILEILRKREATLLERVEQQFLSFKSNLNVSQSHIVDPSRADSLGTMITEARSALSAITDLAKIDFSEIKFS